MYVAIGVAVGRSLDGEEVSVNHSDLPVYLHVGSVRAHRFVGMEGTPIPVRTAPARALHSLFIYIYISSFNFSWYV